VAARNEHAWLPRAHTAAEIATPGPRNRLVSDPYTKLMTANLGVDQAAAVIVCSVQAARDLGVPHDRWVFPVASAHAQDEWFFSERGELAASPAIAAAGRAVLDHAGLAVDEVALIDLYSCFPSAVQIAAEALGLPVDDPARPLTVTGGLTFAGGPGNDYALHAVATLVGRLREQPDAYGLSSALGWYCTKHAYGLYSGSPPQCPFAEIDAAGAVDAPAPRAATAQYVGPARLEAYTVTYARDGDPEALLASALTPDGARALVRDDRAEAIDAVLRDDPLGEPVVISPGALELEPSAVSGGGR
jgi:acetyl-CoA C-acetyltransferase